MRRIVVGLWCIVWLSGNVIAQEGTGLAAEGTIIANQVDAFGQEILVAEGQLLNQSDSAYHNISLLAEVYDASNEVVGEGFGFLVNACGTGLLDFVLQPGMAQNFAVPLELYEEDIEVDRVEVIPQAEPIEAETIATPDLQAGITQVSDREVISVEWLDTTRFHFSEGCPRDLFTEQTWYEYNVETGVQQEIPHPKADIVNNASDAMLLQMELDDPFDLENSFITFQPNGRRLVYQNSRNSLLSAEPDGSFRRLVAERLFNRTLQGIHWLEGGNFLAYYFGAYGDPVLYLTANIEGTILSEHPVDGLPSLIVPGASPDGSRVIIGATINDVTGYYLKLSPYPDTAELLFEAEPPGNNWPGPIYMRPPGDGPRIIYIVRPVDGEARLQCFNLTTRQLLDLAPLPLQLANDERAWMWLSPNSQTIALASNGVHSGLWLIELGAFEACT
jgi:hypothetical protein